MVRVHNRSTAQAIGVGENPLNGKAENLKVLYTHGYDIVLYPIVMVGKFIRELYVRSGTYESNDFLRCSKQ